MVAAFALILHELLLIVLGMGGWSVGFCMAAGIDGICLMRRRTGNQIGTALQDLEKLREEATEFGRRKIRRLFGEDNLGSVEETTVRKDRG
jgi:hypothetical protein